MVKIFNNLLIVFMLLFSLAACEKEGDVATEPGSYPDYTLVVENRFQNDIIIHVEMYNYNCVEESESISNESWGVEINLTLEKGQSVSYYLEGFQMGFPFLQPNYGITGLSEIQFLDDSDTVLATYNGGMLPSEMLDHEWFTESDDRPFYLELDEEDDTVARIIITGEPQ